MNKLYDEMCARFGEREKFFFRGFSIEKKDDTIEIMDVRCSSYKKIRDNDLSVLMDMGFIKGTTFLLMQSDKERLEDSEGSFYNQIRSARLTENSTKKRACLLSASRYKREVDYYDSQITRWNNTLQS